VILLSAIQSKTCQGLETQVDNPKNQAGLFWVNPHKKPTQI